MKKSERGAASRSFVIGVGAVIAAVVGYLAWSVLRPDPYALSERIVRDARREMAAEVRNFQREVDPLAREARREKRDISAQVEQLVAAAEREIADVVDGARDQIAELDIALRTQSNRLNRIEDRAKEAMDMVREHAEAANEKARGD